MHSDARTTLATARAFNGFGAVISDTIDRQSAGPHALGLQPLYAVVTVASALTGSRWLIARVLSSSDANLTTNLRCHAQWGDALLSPSDAGHPTTSSMPVGSFVAVLPLPVGREYQRYTGVLVQAISAAGIPETSMAGTLNIEITDQLPYRFPLPDAVN